MYPPLYIILFSVGLFLLPKLLGLLAPFIVGFLLYLFCRGAVRRISALGIGRGVAAFFSLGFVVVLLLGLAAVLFSFAYSESSRLPQLYSKLSSIEVKNEYLRKFIAVFREDFAETLKALSVRLLSCAENVTGFLLVMVFAVLSAFFFLKDEEQIAAGLHSLFGGRLENGVAFFKESVSSVLSGYIRAQLLLMLLTFCLISVFLLLSGVKYALPIALGTAFVDAIPVFGTGCVLIPWALYKFLSGENALAFGLLALYGACSLMRQLLEPKILSAQIGLHPLLTLAGVFVGYKLLGFFGLIIGPMLTLIFVTYIQKQK